MPRDIWAIDAETDPFKRGRIPQPFLWGVYNGSEYHQFERIEQVVKFVREIDGIFYAHNGGRFDYHYLIPYAEAYDELLVIHGRIAKWRLGLAEMRDSMNILPVPLAAYQKTKVDYSIFEPGVRDRPRNRAIIESYLRSDCVNLWNMVTGFVERYGMSITQASASMKLWQKMADTEVPDSGPTFFDEFKPYYFGGRVQAFRHGVKRGTFYVADVVSAYPAAMLDEHPFGLDPYAARKMRGRIKGRDLYVVHGVARGVFPYRDGIKLLFPDDGNARTYYITGHELQAALEIGALRKGWEIVERVTFTDCVTFKDYILHHHAERKRAKKAGDIAGALFSKLLMNSLYGKFGADPRRYTNHLIVPAESAPVDDPTFPLAGYVGPWALVENPDKPVMSKFYNVATAASITGYQRAVLMRQAHKCDGLIYCDTDSLAAHDLGDIDLGDNLGQWTLEGEFNRYAVAGRKLYAFFGKDMKGEPLVKYASKGAKLYPDEIVRIAQGETVKFVSEVPTFSVIKPPMFVQREIRLTK